MLMAVLSSAWLATCASPASVPLTGFQVQAGSDRELMGALEGLVAGSPRAKAVLENLQRSERCMTVLLEPYAGPDYVQILVRVVPQGYEVRLGVQVQAVRKGKDRLEPWLATALQCLLDLSQNGRLEDVGTGALQFPKSFNPKVWAFQRAVRSELAHAKPGGLPGLAMDGEAIYHSVVVGVPRGLGRF